MERSEVRWGLFLLSWLAGVMTPLASARAQEQEFGPYHRPRVGLEEWDAGKGWRATRLATGDYVHDGLYFRLGGGLGGASDKLRGTGRSSEGPEGRLDGGVNGFAGATQVSLGFTPLRGWVLGVSIDTVVLPSSSGTLSDRGGRFEFNTSQLALFGLLIDYYPDPLRGFHVQATGGLASFIMAQGNASEDNMIAPPHAAVGAGFSLGVGNQWWLDKNWTIGVLPRLTLGWASGTDEFGYDFRHRVLGYSLLLTTSYH